MTRGGSRRTAARVGGTELPIDSPVLERVAHEARDRYLRRRLELAPKAPPAERSKVTEKRWQGHIVDVARRYGWWCYHPLLSRFSEHGWPDLSLLHEGRGRALWVEVKTDDGDLTEHQVAVIDRMLACGLEVHVCRPSHGLEHLAELLRP